MLTFSMGQKHLHIEAMQVLMDSSQSVDNVVMTSSWAPFLSCFIWDVNTLDRFSLLTTTSTEKPLLLFSKGNNFVLSVRSISLSCLADLHDSMTSGYTMILRRQAMMVFRNRINGLPVWNYLKKGSTIPATYLKKCNFAIITGSSNEVFSLCNFRNLDVLV